MFLLTLVQIISLLCAFLGIGQAVAKESSTGEKALGYFACFMFLAAAVLVQEVLK